MAIKELPRISKYWIYRPLQMLLYLSLFQTQYVAYGNSIGSAEPPDSEIESVKTNSIDNTTSLSKPLLSDLRIRLGALKNELSNEKQKLHEGVGRVNTQKILSGIAVLGFTSAIVTAVTSISYSNLRDYSEKVRKGEVGGLIGLRAESEVKISELAKKYQALENEYHNNPPNEIIELNQKRVKLERRHLNIFSELDAIIEKNSNQEFGRKEMKPILDFVLNKDPNVDYPSQDLYKLLEKTKIKVADLHKLRATAISVIQERNEILPKLTDLEGARWKLFRENVDSIHVEVAKLTKVSPQAALDIAYQYNKTVEDRATFDRKAYNFGWAAVLLLFASAGLTKYIDDAYESTDVASMSVERRDILATEIYKMETLIDRLQLL